MRYTIFLPVALGATIAQAQQVSAYRYWFNDDAANAITVSVPATQALHLNTAIPTGDFPAGDFNLVTIQFQDTNSTYSAPWTQAFVRGTGAVNGYEWWIDDAIADRTAGSIGPGEVLDLVTDLPTGVTDGNHTFTIRFSGMSGAWSVPLVAEFTFANDVQELPGITGLLLFPNPVTDRLSLQLHSDHGHLLELTVLDAGGHQVRTHVNWQVSGVGTNTLDLDGLAAGVYGLHIADGTHATTLRFVKH